MKSIQNKKRINKKIITTIATLTVVVIAISAYIFIFSRQNTPTNPTSGSDSSRSTGGSSQKGVTPSKTLPENSQSITTEDVPINTSASATITRLEQKDSIVYFDAMVTNTTQLGKCVVTFTTPNDKPVTREFDATERNGVFICSVTLSALEFSYLGEWEAMLRYYNSNSQVVTKGKVVIS